VEKMEMRGAIGFSLYKKGGFFGLLAKAIRFFTGGRWSHTFVCLYDDPDLGSVVIEAGDLGVSINPFSKYLDEETYSFKIYMPLTKEEHIIEGLKRVIQLNGKPYGYFQLLGFIWIWFMKKVFMKKVRNPIGGGWICSEEVLSYAKRLHIETEKFDELDKDSTSPAELDDIISQSKWFKLILQQGEI
jgi:hypothetical protein